MVQRVWILNWENITYDKDFSAYFFALADPWVYEWLQVQSWKVLPWRAIIAITRANGERVAVYYENTEEVQIDTSGTKKVFISFEEEKLNFWQNNAEDWTWIASINIAENFPSKNYFALATITNWNIRDNRIWAKIKQQILNSTWIYKKDEVYNKSEAENKFVDFTSDQTINWNKTFNWVVKLWQKTDTVNNKNILFWSRYLISNIPHVSWWHKFQIVWWDMVGNPENAEVDGWWWLFFWSNTKKYLEMINNEVIIGSEWQSIKTNSAQWSSWNSLTRRDFVELEIERKVQQAINGISWRSARIDTYLYG